jgi:hypothetical protein
MAKTRRPVVLPAMICEPEPLNGLSEIIVDHYHGGPTQGAGAIDQAVLPAAVLVIIENLIVIS